MTEFKHRHIEVPFLDQTHANFDEWASLVKRMQAERDLEMTTAPRNAQRDMVPLLRRLHPPGRHQVMPAQDVRA